MPLKQGASFLDLTAAVSLTSGSCLKCKKPANEDGTPTDLPHTCVRYNESDREKPWFTGALRRVKRGDWVKVMVRFTGRTTVMLDSLVPVPTAELVTGIVETVRPGVLGIRVQGMPAEQTGLQYDELVNVFTHHILEHVSSDEELLKKTNEVMSPQLDAKDFVPGTIGGAVNWGGQKQDMKQYRASLRAVQPTGPGTYTCRNGNPATIWTADGTGWFGQVDGQNTRWEGNGTVTGNPDLDIVEEVNVRKLQREEVAG